MHVGRVVEDARENVGVGADVGSWNVAFSEQDINLKRTTAHPLRLRDPTRTWPINYRRMPCAATDQPIIDRRRDDWRLTALQRNQLSVSNAHIRKHTVFWPRHT